MNSPTMDSSRAPAEMVLECEDLDANLSFFTEQIAFRLISIFPADEPTAAVIETDGLRIRLEKAEADAGGNARIRLARTGARSIRQDDFPRVAPNGVVIELAAAETPLSVPKLEPSFVLTKFSSYAGWKTGRAGMLYRDLIPGRLGGRFIASHIMIPEGGKVPDYVHFHNIRFQTIYCLNGWARLVYQDQGEPFRFDAGDCVLQPPKIRHRVLECSDEFQVIEISSPAEHETFADRALSLPTDSHVPDREFGGQRFVRHIAAKAGWGEWRVKGFEARDTGIGEATKGLAGVRVVRPSSAPVPGLMVHDAEFVFVFVQRGAVSLERADSGPEPLVRGDSFVIPAGMAYGFLSCSDDLEMLEVTLPAEPNIRST